MLAIKTNPKHRESQKSKLTFYVTDTKFTTSTGVENKSNAFTFLL
ncbi:hypothetical protein [Flavobacterium faecale]|nr:hypothetical protein [Flavobacterium faecale]